MSVSAVEADKGVCERVSERDVQRVERERERERESERETHTQRERQRERERERERELYIPAKLQGAGVRADSTTVATAPSRRPRHHR